MSFLCLRLNSAIKWLTIQLSKSSPLKWVSPAVDLTSKIPSSIVRIDTSKVPPPKSKVSTFLSAPTFFNSSSIFGSLTLRVIKVSRYCDNSIGNSLPKVGFCDFLHLCQNHRRHLLWIETFCLSLVFYLDLGPACIIHHHEGPMLHIRLDNSIIKSTSNQTFGIKNRVGRVRCNLVLCSITDQSFRVSKSDIAWGGSVSLIIGYYFHFSMLENTHTRVGGAKINANCRSLRHGCLIVDRLRLRKRH
uniref:Uncharacterized protein n=1 Tax=Equus caballus TaxID=9796 RepID=A0A9L0RTU8_HORSE